MYLIYWHWNPPEGCEDASAIVEGWQEMENITYLLRLLEIPYTVRHEPVTENLPFEPQDLETSLHEKAPDIVPWWNASGRDPAF